MKELKKIPASQLIDQIDRENTADKVWVFDCDGTLISGDVSSHTAWWLIRSGLAHPEHLPGDWKIFKDAPFEFEAFHTLRKLVIEKRGLMGVYEWEMLLQAGLPRDQLRGLVVQAVAAGEKQGTVVFTDIVAELARKHCDQSWIVSGSPHDCVIAIGSRLGIPEHRVLGTMLDEVDGIINAKILSPGVVWEELKKHVLEGQGVHNPWFVAGDSIGDWYMFEMATRWCWCTVWDEHRHRGEEFREVVQERVLGPDLRLPREAGTYLTTINDKNWVIEVKRP